MESKRSESGEYVLAECCSLGDLQDPLKRSSRLKYNCMSVSTRYVAIGTNTGGIYIFSRTDHKLLQIAFAEKATNSVTSVLLSPNEKFVAIVCGTTVHVIDMKLDSRSKPETLRTTDVRDTSVTTLFWDTTSSRLYIGDVLGKVYLILVHSNKAKNLFSLPLEVIMKLDSQVVQIDKCDDKLLVSTLTRCYLSDTSKQQYSQVGKKLRDGQFGACFMSQNSSGAMIYCARPGSRIWEVDYNGNVLNTHQFKQLLAIPPSTILQPAGMFDPPDKSATYPGQAVVFPQLKVICNSFIMSWTSSSIFVLDPVNVKVVLWCGGFSGTEIQDVCCVEDKIVVFLKNMQIRCLSVLPVTYTIPLFISSKNYVNAARTILYFAQSFQDSLSYLKRKHLDQVCDYLTKEGMQDLLKELFEILPELENYQKVSDGSDVEKDETKVTQIIVKNNNIVHLGGKNELEKKDKDSVIHIAFEDIGETHEVHKKTIGHSLSQEVADSGDAVVCCLDERIKSNDIVTHLDGIKSENGDVEFVIKEKLELNNGSGDSVSVDSALPQENLSWETNSNKLIENEVEKYDQTEIIPHDFRDKLISNANANETFKSAGIPVVALPNAKPGFSESQQVSQQLNEVKKQGAISPVLGHQQEKPVGIMEISLDEDDFLNEGPKNIGSRRQSITSLSSLSSMEVSFDPGNSESDPIAVPVRRKTSRKASRTSSSEEGGLKKKKDDTSASPRGSIHSLVEEDKVPFPDVEPQSRSTDLEVQSNDDSATIGEEENKSLPNSFGSTKVKEALGSPVTKETSQLSQSGEFLLNEELGNSGEMELSGELGSSGGVSPTEGSFTAQFQKPKLKSVAKKAAMQLKDK